MGMDVYGRNPKLNKIREEFPIYNKYQKIEEDADEADEGFHKKWKELNADETLREQYWKEQNEYQKKNIGIYFRNNCWYWRPLWDYCAHIAPELINEKLWNSGHHNDGAGLNELDAAKLGVKLMTAIEDGSVEHHEKEIELINEQKEADGDDMNYPFYTENVKAFAEFCLESGGFSIN